MHLHVENRGQLQVVYHPPFLGSGVGPLVGLGCPKYVRLRSELQESPCLCPPGAAQAYRYTLPYLTFLILVLGLELRSSCLRDKLLTDQTISLGLLSFFETVPLCLQPCLGHVVLSCFALIGAAVTDMSYHAYLESALGSLWLICLTFDLKVSYICVLITHSLSLEFYKNVWLRSTELFNSYLY